MATVHTVQQGETLNRIARQYDFISGEKIYNHEDNAEFRALRTNPNVIYPGDQINIPDKEDKVVWGSTNQTHVFRVPRPQIDMFCVRIQNRAGKPWAGKRVTLTVGGQHIDAPIGSNGLIKVDLPDGNETTGELKIFMDPNSDEPTHQYDVQLGHLDPVEELSGVQARCNFLSFECGVADGIMGRRTRAGVKEFQAEHDLDVDGVPGPMTKGKLEEVFGC